MLVEENKYMQEFTSDQLPAVLEGVKIAREVSKEYEQNGGRWTDASTLGTHIPLETNMFEEAAKLDLDRYFSIYSRHTIEGSIRIAGVKADIKGYVAGKSPDIFPNATMFGSFEEMLDLNPHNANHLNSVYRSTADAQAYTDGLLWVKLNASHDCTEHKQSIYNGCFVNKWKSYSPRADLLTLPAEAKGIIRISKPDAIERMGQIFPAKTPLSELAQKYYPESNIVTVTALPRSK